MTCEVDLAARAMVHAQLADAVEILHAAEQATAHAVDPAQDDTGGNLVVQTDDPLQESFGLPYFGDREAYRKRYINQDRSRLRERIPWSTVPSTSWNVRKP